MLSRLTVIFAAIYCASIAGLFAINLKPAVPWTTSVLILVAGLPFGIFFNGLSEWKPGRVWCIPAAVVAIFVAQYHFVWLAACLFLAVCYTSRASVGRVIKTGSCIVLGYASVWNLNYLAAHFSRGHVDAPFLALDLRLYSLIGITSYAGAFPIFHSAVANLALSNAYEMLFLEMFLVVWLVCQRSEKLATEFIVWLFGLFGLGVVCFVAMPVLGPFLYAPESLRAGADLAYASQIRADYAAATTGGKLSGYGYFVSLPSLHVLTALLMQRFLSRKRVLFWAFLPLNCLIILSTFLLGYHYIADVVAAGGVFWAAEWIRRRSRASTLRHIHQKRELRRPPVLFPTVEPVVQTFE